MHNLNKFISKELVYGLPKLQFEKDYIYGAYQKENKSKNLLN